jgi:hypothetical protein
LLALLLGESGAVEPFLITIVDDGDLTERGSFGVELEGDGQTVDCPSVAVAWTSRVCKPSASDEREREALNPLWVESG